MPGGKNSPISLNSNENTSARATDAPAIRVGRRFQANIPKLTAMTNRERRNANDSRVGTLITYNNVRRDEGRASAALWQEVVEFIDKNPKATEAAAREADALGLSVVLKRVKRPGTKQAYDWKVRMYRGG